MNLILKATQFAALKHCDQRRKDGMRMDRRSQKETSTRMGILFLKIVGIKMVVKQSVSNPPN